MSGRILSKEATLCCFNGEKGGTAQYTTIHLRKIYYQEVVGTVAAETAPSDLLTLYYFDRKSTATTTSGTPAQYLDPDEYKERLDKDNIFTLSEGDIIVPGIHISMEKPLKIYGARKITSVYRLKAGSPRMWHWKVVAK